jgi:O-antigen ligase
MGIIIASTSFISLILSGTRTSIWLGFLIIISMIIVSKIRNNQKTKAIVPSLLVILGIGAPFVLLLIGFSIGNTEWSTLNGRTQMWSCVLDRSSEFIPIGVGLDDAFPPKFCAESGWFSNLRHPENMFLLAFVESGPLGLMAYVLLFTFTIIKSFGAFKRRMILPLILTVTFLLSNLIYVSLFHYLPFLPNRPADRGIFNFHLFYLVWIWIMKDAKSILEKKV